MKTGLYIAVAGIIMLATLSSSRADLTHYWTFDANYTDSIGSADGSASVTAPSTVSITSVDGEYVRGSGGLKIDSNAGGKAYVDITEAVVAAAQNSAYSISAWYRYEDIGADGSDPRNCIWETSPGYQSSFGLRDLPRDAQWYVQGTPVTLNGYSAQDVDDDLWHHVVMIWDKPGNIIRVYHDGVLASSPAIGSTDILAGANGLHIGDYRDGNGWRNFDGYIDDFAIYDNAITSDDVLNLFHGASPEQLDRPPVRAVQLVSEAGYDFSVTNGTVGFDVNFQNLNSGDHELYSSDSRLLQTNGVIIGSANDGGDSIFQVGGGLTSPVDPRYRLGMAFSTADLSGGGEKNFDMSFAYFPFNWDGDGWIAAHVATNGSILAGPHLPAGTTVTKLSTAPAWRGPGQFVIHIPGVDSRTDGMLFVVGGENDQNVTVAGVFEDTDDVNIVTNDAALGDWHVHIRDAGHNDISSIGEDGTFSFLYLPYNTVNLIGGRITDDGLVAVLKSTGTFTASDGDSLGQIDISIPDGQGGFLSDQDGILILTCSAVIDNINSGTNQDPVDGNVLSWTYDAADEEFVVHAFDAPDGSAQSVRDFVFAFVPYEASLQPPPPPLIGTLILIN